MWGEFSFPLFKQPVKSQSNGEFIRGNILLYSLSKKNGAKIARYTSQPCKDSTFDISCEQGGQKIGSYP